MKRRDLLFMIVGGSVSATGCIEDDTQPESVPIWVENQAQQVYNVGVECTQNGKSEAIVSTELDVAPEDEQSVYAKPIRENEKYELMISLPSHLETASITGGNLHSIDVMISGKKRIRISRVNT